MAALAAAGVHNRSTLSLQGPNGPDLYRASSFNSVGGGCDIDDSGVDGFLSETGDHPFDHPFGSEQHRKLDARPSLGHHGIRKLFADQLMVVQQAIMSTQSSILEHVEPVLDQAEKDAQQMRVMLVQAGAPAAAMASEVANRKSIMSPEMRKVSIMPPESRKVSMMPGYSSIPGAIPETRKVSMAAPDSRKVSIAAPRKNIRITSNSGNQLAPRDVASPAPSGQMQPMLSDVRESIEGTHEEDEELTIAAIPSCPGSPPEGPPPDLPMSVVPSLDPPKNLQDYSWTRSGSLDTVDGADDGEKHCTATSSMESEKDWGWQPSMQPTNMKFYLSHVWTKDNESEAAKIGTVREVRNKSLIRAYTATEFDTQEATNTSARLLQGYFKRHIIYPYSIKRAIWDFLSLTAVLYDLVVIPFQLFSPDPTVLDVVMAWVTRLFWTMDMPLSFLTGFMMSDGVIEMRLTRIARHYTTTWFGLDFLLIVMDWVELIGTTGSSWGYARVGKASRIFRILRMARLLRLFRMREVLRQVSERVQSERLTILIDIAKILVVILGLAHILACFWYGIGVQGNSRTTWVRSLDEPRDFENQPLETRYITSLHWSLSQFSGGMDEIRPRNARERVFASGAFILAFIMAAVFVSGLTSSMTRLDILASYQSKQLAVLRRYLLQNRISDKLTLRVQRNALHAMSEQQRLMQETSVELLQVVSEPLRVELHFEMYSAVLEVHPLFLRYTEQCPQVMRRVCHIAASTLVISKGDLIFNAGEIPTQPKMYICCTGSLEYVPIAGDVSKVTEGHWLAEACLWVPWMHRGVLKAAEDGRLCLLDANRFAHVAMQFKHTDFNPRYYAEKFVQLLNTYEDPSMFSDLASGSEQCLVEEAMNRGKPQEKKAWIRRISSAVSKMAGSGGNVTAPVRRPSAFFEKAPSALKR